MNSLKLTLYFLYNLLENIKFQNEGNKNSQVEFLYLIFAIQLQAP